MKNEASRNHKKVSLEKKSSNYSRIGEALIVFLSVYETIIRVGVCDNVDT